MFVYLGVNQKRNEPWIMAFYTWTECYHRGEMNKSYDTLRWPSYFYSCMYRKNQPAILFRNVYGFLLQPHQSDIKTLSTLRFSLEKEFNCKVTFFLDVCQTDITDSII